MTQAEREEAQVVRAERTHQAVMEAMARERPGTNPYTWRDRFRVLWDKHQPPTPRGGTGQST
jgi:hypothetical protein